MSKIIICGGRDFGVRDSKNLYAIDSDMMLFMETLGNFNEQNKITEVVCGGAKGADTLGKQWATTFRVNVKSFEAEWNLFGKGAGHKRNMAMGDYASGAIAFWNGKSKGTKHLIDYMRKIGKPVKVVMYDQEKDPLDDF